MGTLVPRSGIKPGSPALEVWSLKHWTTRKPLGKSKAQCGAQETGMAPILSPTPFGCSWTQFAPPENGKALYFNNLKGLLFAYDDQHKHSH